MSLNTQDLYAIGILSKISGEIGIGMDMMVEILAYYLWRPAKALLYYKDDFTKTLVKCYTIEMAYDNGEYLYADIADDIFTFLLDSNMIVDYSCGFGQISVTNLQNHTYTFNKSVFINDLIDNKKVTSDAEFYILHTLHNFSFELQRP